MITIVDYQMGNLRSVQKGIERVGGSARISSDPAEIREAEKLILEDLSGGAMALNDEPFEGRREVGIGDRIRIRMFYLGCISKTLSAGIQTFSAGTSTTSFRTRKPLYLGFLAV